MPPCALEELFAWSEPLVASATRAPAFSAETAAASPEAPLPITSTSKLCAVCVTRATIPEISGSYSLFTDPVGKAGPRACPREPLQPPRQVPVPGAEQLHRRRQEHGAHDGRIDGDRHREAEPHLLELQQRERREDAEHRDHHRGGARDGRRCASDAVQDRV